MSRIIDTLETYNETELAFLYRFKLETYSSSTQEKVIEFMENRGINEQRAIEIISQRSGTFKDGCPRCGSKKIIHEQVNLTNASENALIRARKTSNGKYVKEVCQVCGIIISDPNDAKGILRFKRRKR